MVKKLILIGIYYLFPFLIINAQTTLAVLDLSGKGIDKMVASSLTDRLRAELFSLKKFNIIERDKMDEILKEQGLQISGCTTNECYIEIGQLLNVEQMVVGSISQVGLTYSISARIISVETGEILIVATYDYKGKIDDLLTKGMKIIAFKLTGIDKEEIQQQQKSQYEDASYEKNSKSIIPQKITKTRTFKSSEIFLSLQANITENNNFASNTQNIWQVFVIGAEISKFFIFQYGISNTITIEKIIPFKGEFINKADINYWFIDAMIKYPIKISKRFLVTPSSGFLYSSIVFLSEESDKIKFVNNGMINQINLKYIYSPFTISIYVRKLFFAKYDNWLGAGVNFGFLF